MSFVVFVVAWLRVLSVSNKLVSTFLLACMFCPIKFFVQSAFIKRYSLLGISEVRGRIFKGVQSILIEIFHKVLRGCDRDGRQDVCNLSYLFCLIVSRREVHPG